MVPATQANEMPLKKLKIIFKNFKMLDIIMLSKQSLQLYSIFSFNHEQQEVYFELYIFIQLPI